MTPDERSAIESGIDKVVSWINTSGWPLNPCGVSGLWGLYNGGFSHPSIDRYRSYLNSLITSEGVFKEGPGHGGARLNGNSMEQCRTSKMHFMDVLEFTGMDSSYYSDPGIRGFHEWLYGYSVSPFGRCYTFGDSGFNSSYIEGSSATFRAYRFSDKAAQYAAWSNHDEQPKGRLLHYVLMGKALPERKRALSRIFWDGGRVVLRG